MGHPLILRVLSRSLMVQPGCHFVELQLVSRAGSQSVCVPSPLLFVAVFGVAPCVPGSSDLRPLADPVLVGLLAQVGSRSPSRRGRGWPHPFGDLPPTLRVLSSWCRSGRGVALLSHRCCLVPVGRSVRGLPHLVCEAVFGVTPSAAGCWSSLPPANLLWPAGLYG